MLYSNYFTTVETLTGGGKNFWRFQKGIRHKYCSEEDNNKRSLPI